MEQLQIYLFGQMRMFVGKRPFPFKALPKVTPLLAYLVLNQTSPTDRHTLAFKLWPDVTEKQAKTHLRRHLYDLRQALPAPLENQEWLLITPRTVQWNPAASYWLDVAAFEHLGQQSSRLVEAIALYSGELLPDVDAAWLLPDRERLQQQYLQVLNALIRHNWQQQDYRQALIYSQKAFAEDNLNEDVIRQQMAFHYALKERAATIQLYQAFVSNLEAELEVEPLPETTAVYTAIQQNKDPQQVFVLAGLAEPSSATSAPPAPKITHNLPVTLRQFIGRQAELEQISDLLTGEHTRLLTLTGTGGIGKTRLAVEVGQQLVKHAAHHFPDGVYFVSLAPLQRPEQLATAVAEALHAKPNGQTTSLEVLQVHLRYQQCLLILDNFEHLLGAAPQLYELLQTAVELRLLITSRTPLNLYGEQEYPLSTLTLPNLSISQSPNLPIAQLQQIESIAFFTAVARATNPKFTLTEANQKAVVHICQQLDGLPLAIELAAARSKHFPPDVLAQQLATNPSLLASQAQDVPERHRTIEAALQWSYDLLSAAEQRLFAQLSVFVDGFSVTAVANVIYNKPFTTLHHHDSETIALLTNLADKNLIYPAQNRMEGELRFAMLNVIRTFASQKLSEADRAELKGKLLRYFSLWKTPVFDSRGTDAEAVWIKYFQVEYKNLTAVLDAAICQTNPDAETAVAVGQITTFVILWQASGHLRALQTYVDWVLAHVEHLPPNLLRHINYSAGTQASARGDYQAAAVYLQTAKELSQQIEYPAGLVVALQQLAVLHSRQGEHETSLTLLKEAEAILDDPDHEIDKRDYIRGVNLGLLGGENYFSGSYAEAERLMLLSLADHQARGDFVNIGHSLHNLSQAAQAQAMYDKAARYCRESILARQQAQDQLGMMKTIKTLADLACVRAEYKTCIMLHSATSFWYQQNGIQEPTRDVQQRQKTLDQCRAELGGKAYQLAWRNGRSLTLDQIIERIQEPTQTSDFSEKSDV